MSDDKDDKPKGRGKAIVPFVVPTNPFGGAGRPDNRPRSVRMKQIRDLLASNLSLAIAAGCIPCSIFLEAMPADNSCPGCGKPYIAFPEGTTRESLFIDSLWRHAVMDPNAPAARLMMEYRYGRVPLAIKHTGDANEGASKTSIRLTVVEVKATEDQPQLLEKGAK